MELSAEDIRLKLRGIHIMLVPGMHADWAWGKSRLWHSRRYVEVLEHVLDLLDRDETFRWSIDCYKTGFEPFMIARPDLLDRLHGYVRQGKVNLCGGFSNIRPNMTGNEAYIRNMVIGRSRFHQAFPDALFAVHAESVDVSVGHPQIPQLLKLGGWKYLRFGRPYEVLSRKGIPREFIWQGLDGSRVLASFGNYSGLFQREAAELDFAERRYEAYAWLYHHELKSLLETTTVGLIWLPVGCDDNYPLHTWHGSQLDIDRLVEELSQIPGASIRIASPAEYFESLERFRDMLRTVRGTLDPCDVCYNMAWNGEKGLDHLRIIGDREIVQCEIWQSIARFWGYDQSVDTTILWENNLTASAHATQWLFKNDFENIRMLALQSATLALMGKRNALRYLAQAIRPGRDIHAIVFNPECRERRAFLRIQVPCNESSEVFRDSHGINVPVQLLRSMTGDGMIWEQEWLIQINLPSLGFNTLAVQNRATTGRQVFTGASRQQVRKKLPANLVFGSDTLQLDIEDGCIVRIHDISQGILHASGSGSSWNSISLSHTDPLKGELLAGPVTDISTAVWQDHAILAEGPLMWRMRLWGIVENLDVCQDLILFAGETQLHLTVKVIWKKTNGYLCAQVPVAMDCSLTGGIPFGTEAKNVKNEPYSDPETGYFDMHRQRKGLFFAKDFVISQEERSWTAFIAPDSSRYYIHDLEKGVLQNILINSVVLENLVGEDAELASAMTFEGVGEHEFTYTIALGTGKSDPVRIQEISGDLGEKPEVVYTERIFQDGSEGVESFVTISQGLILSALYFKDGYLFVRVWDCLGITRPVSICFNLLGTVFRYALATDFHGNMQPGSRIETKGSTLSFTINHHEIVTVKCFLPI